jgi:hypothetical protein
MFHNVTKHWKGIFEIDLEYGYQDCHYDKNRKNKKGTKTKKVKV